MAPNASNREVKLTDSGRTVYGGGGITPDEKIESPKTNRFQDELTYKDVFFHFAPVYVATHTVDKNFEVDNAVMAEFKKYLTGQRHRLHRRRRQRRLRLDQGAHQEGHRNHSVRPVGRFARHRRLGSRDPEGAHLHARGAGPRRHRPQGAGRKSPGAQRPTATRPRAALTRKAQHQVHKGHPAGWPLCWADFDWELFEECVACSADTTPASAVQPLDAPNVRIGAYFGGGGVKISRFCEGSGFGFGFGAFLASFLPLSLLPMHPSMTQMPAQEKS